MTFAGVRQELGPKSSELPVPGATWPALRDDPRVAGAMALPLGFGPGNEDVGAAARRCATLGILHARMSAAHPGKGIDLARCLRALRTAELSAIPSAMPGATVYADLQPLIVRAEAVVLIGLAFCELLRNALTHAFPCSGTGRIGVHLWPVGTLPGVRAFVLVADDGQGFGDEPLATSDRGIPLARHLVERCGARLTREPGPGTVWRIALPPTTEAGSERTGTGPHLVIGLCEADSSLVTRTVPEGDARSQASGTTA